MQTEIVNLNSPLASKRKNIENMLKLHSKKYSDTAQKVSTDLMRYIQSNLKDWKSALK